MPVVSGHLGGANDLAREIARICGAEAVITTATDLRHAFAVDEWARRQGCVVTEPGKIKEISSRVLQGESIRVFSRWPVSGTPPEGVLLTGEEGCHVRVDVGRGDGRALSLVPRVAVLGVGCRRGTSRETLEAAFSALCRETGLWPEAVVLAATIDLKAAEPGLLTKKPRNPKEGILTKRFILQILLQGALIAVCTMTAYHTGLATGSEAAASTMAFSTLTLARLFHGFNCRSSHSIFKIGLMSNLYSIMAFEAGVVLLAAVLFVPGLQTLFSVADLSVRQLLTIVIFAVVPTLVIQAFKTVRESMR